jgi:hypothetical protein
MGRIETPQQHTAPAFTLPRFLSELVDDARDWCRGKMWIPRALLLLFLVYIEWLKLRDVTRWTIFYGITLGFHEMGHLVTAWMGEFLCALMGSVFQVAVPVIVIGMFLRQRDYFGMSVGGFWLSYSLFELSAYVGDARSRDLPLVGFASQEDLQHDWAYLLGKVHMLPLDHFFAFLLKSAATASGVLSFAFAVWLLLEMRRHPR